LDLRAVVFAIALQPTLSSLKFLYPICVTISISNPVSVTKTIGFFTTATKAPTQRAKSTLIPIFID
jgi:hypothetical protein